MTQRAVIPVLGADFAGGSLANLMLDSHPRVFGGGDVYKLFDKVKRARCSVCIRDCPIWNDRELRTELKPENVYGVIARRTGADVLVDSSKTLRHFSAVFGRRQAEFVPLLLVKHPARMMGSFLSNKLIPSTIGLEAYDKHGLEAAERETVIEALDDYFTRLRKQHQAVVAFLDEHGFDADVATVRYEDLVTAPRDALTPVLERAGLAWADQMLDFSDLEHHPIGGNVGAHFHLRRQPNPELQGRREGRMTAEKAAFYGDKSSALKLDDKYKLVVPESWRGEIFARATYAALCGVLGYDEVPVG